MNFYVIRPDEKFKYVDFDDDFEHFDSIKCPVYPGHQRANRNDFPLHVEFMSKKYGDLIYTWFADWIINQKIADIFKEQNLSGYTLREVFVKNKEITEPLCELLITGNGGNAHPDAGMYVKYICEHCNHASYSDVVDGKGIIVDEANWDGSDFFYVTECGKILLITEKAKNVIESNKLSGVKIMPGTEFVCRY